MKRECFCQPGTLILSFSFKQYEKLSGRHLFESQKSSSAEVILIVEFSGLVILVIILH